MSWPREGSAGAVLMPRCPRCGVWGWPVSPLCTLCGGEWAEASVSGTGVVRSRVRVHRGVDPRHLASGPFEVVLVKLDEGIDLVTRWSGEPGEGRCRLVWGPLAVTAQRWPLARPVTPYSASPPPTGSTR